MKSSICHVQYLIGILGFTVPNFAVKIKPSKAMKANCRNVIKLPLVGKSLQIQKKIKLPQCNDICVLQPIFLICPIIQRCQVVVCYETKLISCFNCSS